MTDTQAAGTYLTTLLKARGYSAPDLSKLTRGLVAPSTVRSYLRGESQPRASYAVAIARCFDLREGAEVLRLWGFDEASQRLLEEASSREDYADRYESLVESPEHDRIRTYSIETDSNVGTRTVPVGWRTGIEVISATETSYGVDYIARTDSGTLIRVVPIFRIDVAESFNIESHTAPESALDAD